MRSVSLLGPRDPAHLESLLVCGSRWFLGPMAGRERPFTAFDVWYIAQGHESLVHDSRFCVSESMQSSLGCCCDYLKVKKRNPHKSATSWRRTTTRRFPRPVAARESPHREALWKVLCSPSCSSRAAPVALVTKRRLFVQSHSPVHLVSLMHWFD